MEPIVRRLEESDADDIRRLSREAFGAWDEDAQPVSPFVAPGRHWWGVTVGTELAAIAADREFDSWFGGVIVPTAGIAAVTVAAEYRGRGLLARLFTSMLDAARERGASISTLYPTAAGIYRPQGYETISALDDIRLKTAGLAKLRSPVATRRATLTDADVVRELYQRWAAEHNAPLTRRGPSFPDTEAWFGDMSTCTLAHVDGVVTGYLTWDRGRGYGSGAELRIGDVIADDVDSLRALLAVAGSFASVTPTTLIRTSDLDPIRHVLPATDIEMVLSRPYMLRMLDVAAFELLSYPPDLDFELRFTYLGAGHMLRIEGGRGRLTALDDLPPRTVSPSGLALAFAGAQPSATQRRLGLLHGGDPADDVRWDLLSGGRRVHIRDYF